MYADASYENLPDGGSLVFWGCLVFLVGEIKNCAMLNWQYKRIKCFVRSSLAAEALALSYAMTNQR